MNRLNKHRVRSSKIFQGFGILFLIASLTSCSLDGGAPQASTNQNQEEPSMADSEREYLSVSDNPDVEPTVGRPIGDAPTTLISRDIIVGDGDSVLPTSNLTAHYQLISWTSGEVLQSSWATGPFSTTLDRVIAGWQQGLIGMKVGGRRLLVIPPELAYGATGGGPVAPNETIAFVVDLLGLQ